MCRNPAPSASLRNSTGSSNRGSTTMSARHEPPEGSRELGTLEDFRQLSKIATAVRLSWSGRTQREARLIDKLFDSKDKTSIRDAYASTVEFQYDEKKASRNIIALSNFIQDILMKEGTLN